MGFVLLTPNIEIVAGWVNMSNKQLKIFSSPSKRPTTYIVPASVAAPKWLAVKNTLAIRLSNDPLSKIFVACWVFLLFQRVPICMEKTHVNRLKKFKKSWVLNWITQCLNKQALLTIPPLLLTCPLEKPSGLNCQLQQITAIITVTFLRGDTWMSMALLETR